MRTNEKDNIAAIGLAGIALLGAGYLVMPKKMPIPFPTNEISIDTTSQPGHCIYEAQQRPEQQLFFRDRYCDGSFPEVKFLDEDGVLRHITSNDDYVLEGKKSVFDEVLQNRRWRAAHGEPLPEDTIDWENPVLYK